MALHQIALVVTTPPHNNFTATAIDMAKSIISMADTQLVGVFFYQDGVLNAQQDLAMPSDEFQAVKAWQSIKQDYDIPLHLCVTAGEKRGLTDDESRLNILDEFTISGLGELVELTTQADRVIQL